MLDVENLPGSYVLILSCPQPMRAAIGKRLSVSLHSGYYAYCGSAMGPGGLAARLGHHTRELKRRHWHIDYLRDYAHLIEIWYCHDPWLTECQWLALLKSIGELYVPIKGFGASDCACDSHLLYSSTKPAIELFKQIVMKQKHIQTEIHRINMELVANGKG